MKKIMSIIPHINIIIFIMLLTFFIINQFFNPAMGFLSNIMTYRLIYAYVVLSFISSVRMIVFQRRYAVNEEMRKQQMNNNYR